MGNRIFWQIGWFVSEKQMCQNQKCMIRSPKMAVLLSAHPLLHVSISATPYYLSDLLYTFCPRPHLMIHLILSEWVSEIALSCLTPCNHVHCSPPGFSIHGILQARILEWVAISLSRGSFQPRDQTQVSRIVGTRFNLGATKEAHSNSSKGWWRACSSAGFSGNGWVNGTSIPLLSGNATFCPGWRWPPYSVHCLGYAVGCHSKTLFQTSKIPLSIKPLMSVADSRLSLVLKLGKLAWGRQHNTKIST